MSKTDKEILEYYIKKYGKPSKIAREKEKFERLKSYTEELSKRLAMNVKSLYYGYNYIKPSIGVYVNKSGGLQLLYCGRYVTYPDLLNIIQCLLIIEKKSNKKEWFIGKLKMLIEEKGTAAEELLKEE